MELTILGSRNNAGVFGEALELVLRLGERLRVLVTHRFPLDEAQAALTLAHDRPHEAQKVMLVVNPS